MEDIKNLGADLQFTPQDETRELIINTLAEIVRLLPEQRVGQIIYNYINARCIDNDPFFLSDRALLKILEEERDLFKETSGN